MRRMRSAGGLTSSCLWFSRIPHVHTRQSTGRILHTLLQAWPDLSSVSVGIVVLSGLQYVGIILGFQVY